MEHWRLILIALLVVFAASNSLAQWGGEGQKYEMKTFQLDKDESTFQEKIEDGVKLDIISASWGSGVGTADGISWQKQEAIVEAKINGKAFSLTGQNGGIEILDNLVFLIFKDATISIDSKVAGKKDVSFFTDAIGKRVKKLMVTERIVPMSRFSVSIKGTKATAIGTLVIAMDNFTPNGQANPNYYYKPFIKNLATWNVKK
jgi:hypothetical protein